MNREVIEGEEREGKGIGPGTGWIPLKIQLPQELLAGYVPIDVAQNAFAIETFQYRTTDCIVIDEFIYLYSM